MRTATQIVAVPVLACTVWAAVPVVRSVEVSGSALAVNLATQVGRPYDTRSIEQDVRYLWRLDRFDDIRVETAPVPAGGVAVRFRTTPRRVYTIRQVRLVPHSAGLSIALEEGARIDQRHAQEIAAGARRQLEERGFRNARIDYEFIPVAAGRYDLKLEIDPGKGVRVRDVAFTGNTGVPPDQLAHALRALRPRRILPGIPGLWNGWGLMPSYTDSAIDADMVRLRSFYLLRGYVDADVRRASVETAGSDARVALQVNAGERRGTVPPDLCRTLFAERRAAERRGVIGFTVSAEVTTSGAFTWGAEPAPSYRVGRIQLFGNRRYTDSFLRRNLLLDEGDLFDDRRLRRSLARLNRTGLFAPLDETSVAVLPNSRTGLADVNIRVTERKRGSWSLSGPVGPISLGGPLRGSVSMHLPAWGAGLLELSTYTASLSVFGLARPLLPDIGIASNRRWFPILSIERPYTAGEGWRSGFAIAPQLGWRALAANYLITQTRERLTTALAGEKGLVPDLPVTVHRPAGDIGLLCEPPAPRLGPLRTAAAFALNAAGSLAGF